MTTNIPAESLRIGDTVLALAVGATSVWSYVLLTRSPSWHPQLQGFVLLAGLGLAVLIAAWAPALRGAARAALAVAAVGVGLMSPLVASVATAAVPHAGAIPSAAPAVAGGRFGPGGGPPGGPRPGPFGAPPGPGGIGGLLNGSTSTPQLTALLQQSASGYRWVAAASPVRGPLLHVTRPATSWPVACQ